MKRFSTISMALVFGTLMLAASIASAKGHSSSCQSSHHHHDGCDSGCHKPCDPCKGNGKCGSGGGIVVSEPVSPPTHPIYHPIIGKYPVTTVFGNPTPVKNFNGAAGRLSGTAATQLFGGKKGTTQSPSGTGTLLNGLNNIVNGAEQVGSGAVETILGWL